LQRFDAGTGQSTSMEENDDDDLYGPHRSMIMGHAAGGAVG